MIDAVKNAGFAGEAAAPHAADAAFQPLGGQGAAAVSSEAFLAALRGGEPVALSASASTPLRRPPHAFLDRGAAGEAVTVRVAVPDRGLLSAVDGRTRLEGRVEAAARDAFGNGHDVVLGEPQVAALESLVPAAGSGAAVPFVAVAAPEGPSAQARTSLGVMLSAPGAIAYLQVEDGGLVNASLVTPQGAGSAAQVRVSHGLISLGERPVAMDPRAVERLTVALDSIAAANRDGQAPASLKDDIALLSRGAIPV